MVGRVILPLVHGCLPDPNSSHPVSLAGSMHAKMYYIVSSLLIPEQIHQATPTPIPSPASSRPTTRRRRQPLGHRTRRGRPLPRRVARGRDEAERRAVIHDLARRGVRDRLAKRIQAHARRARVPCRSGKQGWRGGHARGAKVGLHGWTCVGGRLFDWDRCRRVERPVGCGTKVSKVVKVTRGVC